MSKSRKSAKKKSGYKKVFKGVRYIANVLVKYYSKKYPSYSLALPKAREVYSLLKGSGVKVTVSSVRSIVSKKRVPKEKGLPELDSSLLQVSPYFELVDYPTYILRSSNKIRFKSKLIPEGLPSIMGGDKVDYSKYFAPYVNHINKMAGLTKPEDNRYETDWLVTCTAPFFDTAKKEWVSEIISLDNLGDEVDYGFNPNKPNLSPEKAIVKGELPSEVKSTPEVIKTSEIDKMIELEKLQQKTIEEKMKAFRELKESGMTIEQINKFLGL